MTSAGSDASEADRWPSASSTFRDVFAEHAAGVCVVLWRSGDRVGGLTVSSVVSVSAEPSILAFSVDRRSGRLAGLLAAGEVTVSFLGEGHEAVARRFAERGVDPVPGARLLQDASGAPAVGGCRAWIRGAVVSSTPVGASVLVVLRALECRLTSGRAPLVYLRRRLITVPPPDGRE